MTLLERTGQLASLSAALSAASAGTGSICLVAGEAGIGKSSLVASFTDEVRRTHRQTRVLWGACDSLFTPRPLGPLHDMSRDTSRLRAALDVAERHRSAIFTAFFEELAEPACTTIAVFEDVHWADEATLDLLKFIGRRVPQTGSLLIVTYRDDEVGPDHALRQVLGDLPSGTMHRIALPVLTEAAVRTLAEKAGRTADGLYELTGGNPFFVTEALSGEAGAVPASVRDAVLARGLRMTPAAREVLAIVALVPNRTEWWLLEALLDDLRHTVTECTATGILVAAADSVAFRHELARHAWEEAMEPARAHELHQRILRVLEDNEGVALARLAHHAARAGRTDAVLKHSPAAAREAARLGAHRAAVAHYSTALSVAGTLPPLQRARLYVATSYEYYLTGQIESAIQARRNALQIFRREAAEREVGESFRCLSRLSWFQARRKEANAFARRAIEVLEPLGSSSALAYAYSNQAQLHMFADRRDDALYWGGRARSIAAAAGDDEMLAYALTNVGTAALLLGDEAGRRTLEDALRIALDHGFDEFAAQAYTNLTACAVDSRDYARATTYLEQGLTYCAERDLDSWTLYLLGWRARAALEQGRWVDATTDLSVILGQSGSTSAVVRLLGLIPLSRLRARRGDPGAQSALDQALDLALPTGELRRIGPVRVARAEAAFLRGDPASAMAEARAGLDLAVEGCSPWTVSELRYWLWKSGADEGGVNGVTEPFRLQMEGHWERAAAAWETLGCPYEQAMSLAESGDTGAMQEALRMLHALGAAPAADHVARQLRARGVRRLPRGPRPSTRRNPAGLTNRQLDVLALIAQGLSNAGVAQRLFLSPKTVDHHVSAILTRLNVRTRTEAAAVALERGLLADTQRASSRS